MKTQPRIRITCRDGQVQGRCGCGASLSGSFYPLDLESVADWLREHWLVEHATRRQLAWRAIATIGRDEHLRKINWPDLTPTTHTNREKLK